MVSKKLFSRKVTSRLFVIFILAPLTLAFQNCDGFVMQDMPVAGIGGGNGGTTIEDIVQGKTLYAQSCASCHGPSDSTGKRNRTAGQITAAIATQPLMANLTLSTDQIVLIAKALSNEPVTPPVVTNPDNRQEFACAIGDVQKTPVVKLTNREYKAALFALLDDFAATLRQDATLVTLIDALPTDIATQDRNTFKEQSLLVTAPISNGLFNASFRAGELIAGATSGLLNYPNTANCLNAATITQSCHQNFVRELGSRAFRRPLSTTEGNAVAARIWDNSLSKTELLQLTFTSVAMMPDFLYKIYDQGSAASGGTLSLTAHEFATKMSFFLTGAPADATLKGLAANGQILNDSIISQQVDRLLGTNGAREMVRRLFRESYGYDVYDNFQYNSTFIGGMSVSGLKDVMTSELDGYFNEIVLNRSGSFQDLMTSKYTNATDARLGTIYGVSSATNTLPNERAGFLNRAAMLTKRSGFTHSPIKRGLDVIEHVLCQEIGLPPPSAPTALPPLTEELISTRIRTERTTEVANSTCVACHSRFNGLGYAFDNFDSFGRHRTTETIYNNGTAVGQVAVNASITTTEVSGSSRSIASSQQLVEDLGVSDKAMMCFVKHLKRFESRIAVDATANCQMNQSLKTMYGDNVTQGSVKDAIKSLVMSPEFRRWKN